MRILSVRAELHLCEVRGSSLKTTHIVAAHMSNSPLSPVQHVWGPCSQQLLLVGRAEHSSPELSAAFVSVGGQVIYQQTDMPVALSSVTWGSAGLVAVACHTSDKGSKFAGMLDEHEGSIYLCSVSEPEPVLQVLRIVPSGACITQLCFSACGLLLAWLDHGDGMSPEMDFLTFTNVIQVTGTTAATVCQVTSGQKVTAVDIGHSRFAWQPGESCTHGMHLVWGQGSRSLIVSGPASEPADDDCFPVQQLRFVV